MPVLKYSCFCWLVYDRALVFEPSRPLACNMMLVWLIYVLELCCDIFPWVPDLDRTRLRAWLVYDWIGGVTSWYQSRLPVGIPLPTPWPKSSLDITKTFTYLAVCLTGPRRHRVVVGSFIPRPILWDSDISSIRVKWILLNLTLGSRYHFHPESPLLLMIVYCTRKFQRYSPMFPRDPCALRRCNSIPPINPYGKLHTLVVHNFIPGWSCYYKIPWNPPYCSENILCLLPCSCLPHEYPYG